MGKLIYAPVLVIAIASFVFISSGNTANAAVSVWQQSAAVLPRSTGDFSSDSFRQSLRDLSAAGADFVTLVIPYWQSNRFSTDIQRGFNTPTDESLINAIQFAHALGMRVSLAVYLDTFEGLWRAEINPPDRDGWFGAYGEVLNRYAAIARDAQVEHYILGTELIKMSAFTSNPDNTRQWQNLINNVRGIYAGPLTYSANWGPSGFTDEKNHIGFWPDLNHIGIAAYFNLETGSNSVQDLKNAWNRWNFEHIKPLSDRVGKPVMFTEVGYRSVAGSHQRPWDFNLDGPADETEQANAYEALFSYWNDFPYMAGVSFWNWEVNPNAGGPGNKDYTPQNKQAEEMMRRWFGTSSPSPSPEMPPAGEPFFSTRTSVFSGGPDRPPAPDSDTFTISVEVTNTGDPARNFIVNVEIYDSAGARVFQNFFEDQNFNHQSKQYTVFWSPRAENTGEHIVKIGVFADNWSRLFHWNNDAARVTVDRASGEPPPASPGAIDIWWPTDGARVGGTQPFKALVNQLPITSYQFFWQVDGDRLNMMFDNFEGFPHKEVPVDLSGWTWKGEGPYALNFIAKARDGVTTLAERLINIFVAQ